MRSTGLPEFLIVCSVILYLAGCWKVYAKAGKPGWAILIPIYNYVVVLQIAGQPIWYLLLLLVPLVNLFIYVKTNIELAKRFGEGIGFGLGLALLPVIFWPVLGFGSARYRGSDAAAAASA